MSTRRAQISGLPTRLAIQSWAVLAGLAAGCSSGGFLLDVPDAGRPPQDLALTPDLRRPQDASVDLRSPLSDKLALSAPVAYAVGSLPFFLQVADVNGDGKLDVLTSGGSVYSLLGNGDGTLQAASPLGSGGGYHVGVADLNGDTRPDLVVGVGGGAQVYLTKAEGGFAAPSKVVVGTTGVSIGLGDVQGDGIVDLAVGDYAGSGDHAAYVLLGRGDGSFGPPVQVKTEPNPHALLLADLNHDGRLDLATANYGAESVTVALGLGDGRFLPPQNLSGEPAPIEVRAADLNLDGHVDLIAGSERSNMLSIHLGRGDGTFLPVQRLAVTGERNTYGLAVDDVNGDGVADIVVCSANNGTQISVLLGLGDESFRPPVSFSAGNDTFSIGIADLNGDGLKDIAVSNASSPSQVTVLLNRSPLPPR